MRYWMLLNALDLFRSDANIKDIFRSDEHKITVDFYDERVLIDLTPSSPLVVFTDEQIFSANFHTPFDVVLEKRIKKSTLTEAKLLQNDKILVLHFLKIASFKEEKTTLILELTGRYTNAIILDENGVIVESLKRVANNIRVINNGEIYKPPLPPKNPPKIDRSDDIKNYLLDIYNERNIANLNLLKANYIAQMDRKIESYKSVIDSLPTMQDLIKESDLYSLEAGLILNNINAIKNWSKTVDLMDYEGNQINIDLENAKTPQMAANIKFAKSKRIRSKAKGVHQEIENLSSRIDFYSRIKNSIASSNSLSDLMNKIPQKPSKTKHKVDSDPIDYFLINGYKVGVGRNEKGNIVLLKNAKANDIWLHLKDMPSAHVVIANQKGTPPDDVIKAAATLCAELSTAKKGQFLVDYTQRRFVKIKEKAFVNYTNYKTLSIKL